MDGGQVFVGSGLRRPAFEWTPCNVERLKKMWLEDNMAASAISDELGCSRNAVIGKVHRLKLADRQQDVERIRKHITPEQAEWIAEKLKAGWSYRIIASHIGCSALTIKERARKLGLTDCHVPVASGPRHLAVHQIREEVRPEAATKSFGDPCSIFELTRTSCRWPFEGEGYQAMFCNAEAPEGQSYCRCHYAIATRPTEMGPRYLRRLAAKGHSKGSSSTPCAHILAGDWDAQ